MKEDSNPQAAPEHDEKTGSFAPRTAGEAYYEQEKAKKKSPPWWIAGILAVGLAAGGYVGWMRYQENQLLTSTLVTPDLIESVAALTQAEEEHGHAAAAEPEVELRDRALKAIARLKNAQAQLVAVSQQRPLPLLPSNVRLENSQQALLKYAETNPAKQLPASQLGLYRGILTRCYIGGHDVHWIDEAGSILEHVGVETTLDLNHEKARSIINKAAQLEQVVVVVIYENGHEFFDYNGKRLEPPKD